MLISSNPINHQLTKGNIVPSREINPVDLPYCLTETYRLKVANIGESSPNRGKGKKLASGVHMNKMINKNSTVITVEFLLS